jgi:hypothetical protein
MTDPLRTGIPQAADTLSGLERDARVEQLLLQGLDHYFAHEYDTAIHVWTRVLFLDRGHARARAYIERARSALAERLRESEELLDRGVAAFDRGDTGDARELLTAAASQGAPPEVALSYLGRLDRLEPPRPAAARAPAPTAEDLPVVSQPRLTPAQWLRRAGLAAAGVLLLAVSVWGAIVLLELTEVPSALRLKRQVPVAAANAIADEPLPVPRTADLVLARARSQVSAGLLADALRTLTVIPPADPLQPEADRLRAEIDRLLLATASVPAPDAPALASRQP